MSFLSALMVYSPVNNLSVVSGRLSKGHNTLALLSLEQVAIQILLLVISALCS